MEISAKLANCMEHALAQIVLLHLQDEAATHAKKRLPLTELSEMQQMQSASGAFAADLGGSHLNKVLGQRWLHTLLTWMLWSA